MNKKDCNLPDSRNCSKLIFSSLAALEVLDRVLLGVLLDLLVLHLDLVEHGSLDHNVNFHLRPSVSFVATSSF